MENRKLARVDDDVFVSKLKVNGQNVQLNENCIERTRSRRKPYNFHTQRILTNKLFLPEEPEQTVIEKLILRNRWLLNESQMRNTRQSSSNVNRESPSSARRHSATHSNQNFKTKSEDKKKVLSTYTESSKAVDTRKLIHHPKSGATAASMNTRQRTKIQKLKSVSVTMAEKKRRKRIANTCIRAKRYYTRSGSKRINNNKIADNDKKLKITKNTTTRNRCKNDCKKTDGATSSKYEGRKSVSNNSNSAFSKTEKNKRIFSKDITNNRVKRVAERHTKLPKRQINPVCENNNRQRKKPVQVNESSTNKKSYECVTATVVPFKKRNYRNNNKLNDLQISRSLNRKRNKNIAPKVNCVRKKTEKTELNSKTFRFIKSPCSNLNLSENVDAPEINYLKLPDVVATKEKTPSKLNETDGQNSAILKNLNNSRVKDKQLEYDANSVGIENNDIVLTEDHVIESNVDEDNNSYFKLDKKNNSLSEMSIKFSDSRIENCVPDSVGTLSISKENCVPDSVSSLSILQENSSRENFLPHPISSSSSEISNEKNGFIIECTLVDDNCYNDVSNNKNGKVDAAKEDYLLIEDVALSKNLDNSCTENERLNCACDTLNDVHEEGTLVTESVNPLNETEINSIGKCNVVVDDSKVSNNISQLDRITYKSDLRNNTGENIVDERMINHDKNVNFAFCTETINVTDEIICDDVIEITAPEETTVDCNVNNADQRVCNVNNSSIEDVSSVRIERGVENVFATNNFKKTVLEDDKSTDVDSRGNNLSDFFRCDINDTQSSSGTVKNGQILTRSEDEIGRTKETVLDALGLKFIDKNTGNYTGTLKAVIKLHKKSENDKGYRKMEMRPSNPNFILPDEITDKGGLTERKNHNVATVEKVNNSSYVGNVNYPQSSLSSVNMLSDNTVNEVDTSALGENLSKSILPSVKDKNKSGSLIVPERSSSFSIHPDRLCSDICKYCFGKFGTLDTPCHLAQLKNPARQQKILSCEPHLKTDTCLCDACYRFINRNANRPPKKRKNMSKTYPLGDNVCSVENCVQSVQRYVRRRCLFKLKRRIGKISPNSIKSGQNTYYGLCSQHYCLAGFHTTCGICKKRLSRAPMPVAGSKLADFNRVLIQDDIPVQLTDGVLICKICRYYMNVRLKYGKPSQMPTDQKFHYQKFYKRILDKYNGSEFDGEDDERNSKLVKTNTLRWKKLKKKNNLPESASYNSDDAVLIDDSDHDYANFPDNSTCASQRFNTVTVRPDEESRNRRRKECPNSCGTMNFTNIANLLNPLDGNLTGDKIIDSGGTRIQVKFGNLNIGKLSNLNIGQDSSTATAAAAGGGNSSSNINSNKNNNNKPEMKQQEQQTVSTTDQSNELLHLTANFDFDTADDTTLSTDIRRWEKCVSTIQFEKNTKKLWQELQKPYGNQSSFIRHLIMLEKYWRNGDLTLDRDASSAASRYLNAVKNRIDSLENSAVKNDNTSPKIVNVPTNAFTSAITSMITSTPIETTASTIRSNSNIREPGSSLSEANINGVCTDKNATSDNNQLTSKINSISVNGDDKIFKIDTTAKLLSGHSSCSDIDNDDISNRNGNIIVTLNSALPNKINIADSRQMKIIASSTLCDNIINNNNNNNNNATIMSSSCSDNKDDDDNRANKVVRKIPSLLKVSAAVSSGCYTVLKAPSALYTIKSTDVVQPIVFSNNTNDSIFSKKVYLRREQIRNAKSISSSTRLSREQETLDNGTAVRTTSVATTSKNNLVHVSFLKNLSHNNNYNNNNVNTKKNLTSSTGSFTTCQISSGRSASPITSNITPKVTVSNVLFEPSSSGIGVPLMKLPKALTVTKVDNNKIIPNENSKNNNFKTTTRSFVTADSEKPSVSVFREIVK